MHLSYAELTPRERIATIVDGTSFREILTPFERASSPYLSAQGIVPQRDDGVVIGRARMEKRDLAIAAIDGRFIGGSLGEIGGAKIASMLELAVDGALLLLDTGGIRLQEANLGLLAVAELCDAIVALRDRAPVIAVIAGRVGCYGGLSISASLCSYVIMSEGARFGLNGPEVVEQEAASKSWIRATAPRSGVKPAASGASHKDMRTNSLRMTSRQYVGQSFEG